MRAISVEKLKKVYGTTLAVNEISFEVEEGEIFGFLGPNGAGKTTTIKMLTCQIQPTGGEAKIFDYDIKKDKNKIRKIIGILPQEGKLNELLTAEQNIYFYGMLYEMNRNEIKKRAKELLSVMELENRKKELVKNFSGGMKQRLNFILSIIHNPKILFLDEPTLGLDPQAKRHIWNFIREINDQGKTIFLTTHYMEEADLLCDRVAIIDEGKIIAIGKPSEIKKIIEKDEIIEIYIDYDARLIDDVKSVKDVKQVIYKNEKLVVTVKDRKGLLRDITEKLSDRNIKAIATVEPTLEDVFIHLTGKKLRD